MASFTTLFVASDATLTVLFPGWRAARAAPAKVARKNPFTGDVTKVDDWDPGPPAELPLGFTLFDSRRREVIAPVLPPDDEYQSLLEDGSPILLRTVPHSAMKGISEVELSALAESMVGRSEPPARFVDCPEGEGFIGALPTRAIVPLATLDDDQMQAGRPLDSRRGPLPSHAAAGDLPAAPLAQPPLRSLVIGLRTSLLPRTRPRSAMVK